MVNSEREVLGNERVEKLMRLAYRINMIVPKIAVDRLTGSLSLAIAGNIVGEIYAIMADADIWEEFPKQHTLTFYNDVVNKATKLTKDVIDYVNDFVEKDIFSELVKDEDHFISAFDFYTVIHRWEKSNIIVLSYDDKSNTEKNVQLFANTYLPVVKVVNVIQYQYKKE
jgi:hypothetical protein